ncbi:LolA family protein [Chthonomonas calidirosea]|uniref:LolA family protein n=1 Tax=Chthonomonas calidirosea TaxID=454171 RepID=UPI0006EC55FC|nr:hypothetical protein [Chthonomonas calidirosea]CEK20499.1 outer membrane lipoprotein-sorting protein [Chthonomonas calidirosea]
MQKSFQKWLIGGLAASGLVLCISSRAQTATQILNRVTQRYTALHSYEASYLMTEQVGQMGQLQLKMTLKSIPKERKVYVVTEPTGSGTGQLAMGAAFAQTESVSDGKDVYMYFKALNSYMKRSLQDTTTQFGGLGQFAGGMADINQLKKLGAKLKLLPSSSFGGHPTYVILMTLHAPQPGVPPVSTKIYIDKATYKVLGSVSLVQAQGLAVTTTMKLLSEKLNPDLPKSIFHFTPPPGAKEVQGMPGMTTVGPPQIGAPLQNTKP